MLHTAWGPLCYIRRGAMRFQKMYPSICLQNSKYHENNLITNSITFSGFPSLLYRSHIGDNSVSLNSPSPTLTTASLIQIHAASCGSVFVLLDWSSFTLAADQLSEVPPSSTLSLLPWNLRFEKLKNKGLNKWLPPVLYVAFTDSF